MKYEKHQDTSAQVKFALDKSEIEIEDFVSAKFLGYEKGQEVHLVAGLNCDEPGEPNFKYEILIDPSTGEACLGSPPMTEYEEEDYDEAI